MTALDVGVIVNLIEKNKTKRLRQVIKESKVSDLVDVLDQLENRFKVKFYLHIPTKDSSEVLLQSSQYSRKFILKSLQNKYIASMLEVTESDDSADILSDVSELKLRRIFSFLTKSKKEEIAPLIKYDENTAGGIMQSEVIALRSSMKVKDAKPRVQKELKSIVTANYVHVVDKDQKLKGIISIKDIFLASGSDTLSKIMEKDIVTLSPNQENHEVAVIFREEERIELPVVDRNKKLLGRVTVDDVVDVVEEEAQEDMLKIAGVNPEENIFDPISSSLKRRLPWLTVNLGTAILAALTIALFSETIQGVVILAALMPIIAGMGGNAGTQTLTLIVRGLALDQLNVTNYMKIVKKEVTLGIINGAVIGAVMGIIAYFWTGNSAIGYVIFISMIITLMVAGLTGTLTPLFLKKIKVDPAVASSVIVTTFTDVVGFFVFLGIATVLLQFIA